MFWPDNRKITDIKVREALGYAFPYREVAALDGGDARCDGPAGRLDPAAGASRAARTTPCWTPHQARPKPHKAEALLRQAGYAPGDYTITFAYVDAPVRCRRSRTSS